MAKRLVKNSKGQYGIYDPYQDQVTPITSGMTLVKNTKGKYGFRSGNEVIELDEIPKSINLEETFKKKVDTGLSSATSSTDSTSDYYQSAEAKPAVVEQEDHKQIAKAKIKEKQAQSSRFIDMFGLGQLDYSGLQKYGAIGEFAADVVDVPANLSQALMRGIGGGVVGSEFHESLENGGKFDSDKVAKINKENALRTGSTYLNTLKEKGVLQTDDLSAAGGIAEIVVESIGNMIGAYKKGFQGAVAGGAAGMAGNVVLTEVGAAIGGPVGAAVAAGITTTTGAMMGMRAMTSYATEYGSSIMESLQKKGVDVTDKNQLDKALKDKSTLDEARRIANTRGLTIGMFDALTDGIAGKGAKIAVKIAERSATKAGKVLTSEGAKKVAGRTAAGIELTGGPLGEATAQLATEGKITDYDAVALEAVADLGPAAPATIYARYKAGQINSDLNQKNLTKIDDLKKAKEALPDENQASKQALDNKISALEKENKERNNSMTNALQVAPVPATKRVLELTDAITDIESTLEAIKDGTRTDISQEARKAMWDSLNDMIAERDEIRQEMLKANENEAAVNMAPEKPMKPVIFIGENKEKVENNNATVMSPNKPLEAVKIEEPITFAEKISDEKNAKPGVAYNVAQGDNIFGTIVESDNNGEKQFILAETGKKYASLDDAKFALQEKLTGQRVSEKERTGIDRVKVEGNLANQQIFVGNRENNNQLDLDTKGAIQRAVRAMRSVSNSNVYLYSNSEDYAKGLEHATGGAGTNFDTETNAQVVDANGENSIHINLEKADGATISHEVFHGALLGLAKKDPNAFVTMRDKILDRISEKQNLSVTDETGNKRKVSAKEYLLDFQKRYEGPQFTEADRAEEFLSELAGLMSLEDSTVVKDKSLLDSIKLTIKDVLKKFNVEFDSLNELQDSEDLVQFFKDFNRSVKTGESINLGKVEGITGAAQPTAQAAPAAQTTPVAQPAKTTPKGTLTKFSILGRDNRFNPANANPGEKNVHYGVDEEGDVFMIAPESKLPAMLYEHRAYIGGLYDITVPQGMKMSEGKGVSITELPKVDSQGNLIKKGKLTYTDTQTIKYDIKKEAPAVAATAQPVTQATPATTQPAAKFKETKSGGQESELAPLLTIKREENFKLSDEVIYGKTKIDKKGNTTTEFYTKFGKDEIPVSGQSINYDNENNKFYQDRKGSTGRNGEGGRLLSNFEEDYGIPFEDVLKGLGIKLKDNEEVLNFRVDKESIEMNDKSGPLNKVYGIAYIVKKGTNGMQSKRKEISFSVPKLKYTDAISGISTTQPTTKAVPDKYDFTPNSKYKFTADQYGNQESEFVPMFTIKNEIDEDNQGNSKKSEEITYYAKTEHRANRASGTVSTRFYRGPKEPEYGGSYLIRYRTNESISENRSRLSYDGGKMAADFESDYGIPIEQALANGGMKLKPNQEVYEFQVQSEVYMPTDYKGEQISPRKVYLRDVRLRDKETGKFTYKDDIDVVVPKLKYTDEIAGLPAAQPEAGAAKKSITTRPEGTQKKESVAKIISTATDKAKPSVKVTAEPKPGKLTVGNTKSISERVSKVDGVMGQALAIEPTSPRDMVLQYFIRGGGVIRGNTTKGAKPQPHTLVTLFTKIRAGFYISSKEEMDNRLGLVNNRTGLTITGIAHKLWESKENETFQFEESDFRSAVEFVLLEHISRAGMAKELVETKGSPSQRALISGDAMFDGMDDYEIMSHQYAAQELGVSVEELLANPDKYIKPEVLDGMYDDMLSAFEILDKIQDEEAIKQYLEISKPEDLFLDELVAEAAKPEKTLEEQKNELLAKLKAKKKELYRANKAKKDLINSASGQMSIIKGTQTNLVPPARIDAIKKVLAIEGEIEEINYYLRKVESAIEFKERKTIDAFADVIEQKVEEATVVAGITQPTFFKKKPNSRAMVLDLDKIKVEKPEAYKYIITFKDHENLEKSDLKGILIAGYTSMMKYKAGAEARIEQISQLEDIIGSSDATNTTTKEQFKSDIKASGDFNDAQLAILNEVVDSLNTKLMPEYNSSAESLRLIGFNPDDQLNFYSLTKNILRAKQPQTFIHEIGHFSFYNILSKEDRLEFLKGVVESTYGDKGKSLSSRIAMTSEKAISQDGFRKFEYRTNVADNFSEYFAEQFNQWYLGKKLTPTQFDTIFGKVEKFLQKLIDKLKGGKYIDESLVKYFEKISNAKDVAKAETAKSEVALRNEEDKKLYELQQKNFEAYWNSRGDVTNKSKSKAASEASLALEKYKAEIKNRRDNISDSQRLEVLLSEVNSFGASEEYQYQDLFNKNPLLAALQEQKDALSLYSDKNYVKQEIDYGQTKENALKMQSESIAEAERNIATIERELTKQGVAFDYISAKVEPAPTEASKVDKQIKSLQNEIRQYELEIEDATEEIENTNYNYKEEVDRIKNEKKDLASSSLDKERKAERREELDARIEDAADERDTYIEQYKETIANAKREIKSLQKQIDKLSAKTKAQISGERVVQYEKIKDKYFGGLPANNNRLFFADISREIPIRNDVRADVVLMFGNANIWLNEGADGYVTIEDFQVNQDFLGTGKGKEALSKLTEYADKNDIKLLADVVAQEDRKSGTKKGLSQKQLVDFYKRNGFKSISDEALSKNRQAEEEYLERKPQVVKTKAQISGERVSAGKEKVSGKSVWNHIVSITPDEEDVPTGLKKDIVDRKFYVEDKFDLASLLDTDPAFKDYYESTIKNESFRYDQEEVDPNDLYNTVVVVDGELRDGWSRATNLLFQGEKTAEAYVALPKVTTKAQISGERVAPFLKADPTYKYQMSGTEASLKLIDNIRSKYKMQHTAEEMGIVKRGSRATEKVISDNIVTRVFSGISSAIYKRFSNDRANKVIGKPFAGLQAVVTEKVMRGLGSQNTSAANASAITVSLIQNLGSKEGFQFERNKLVGGKSVAKNELWQFGKELNAMINNDKLALRRVHSLLDPEAFEGITDPTLPASKADLSFAELRLFNTLRDMNDYIHEWHYQNGFLGEGAAAEALYQKNKGSYFARMYNEIENEKFSDLYDALAKLPNAADFTMFKERKDFADVKGKMTLKEDPIYITTKRFGQMMQNQAILQFCDYVAKSGDYQIYDNKEDIPAGALKSGNYRRMPYGKNGGKTYGALTGKLVPDIVAQQLLGIEFSNQVVNLTYQAAKVFDKTFARQMFSKLKTTWNPLTRAGNITMNFVFASLAGVDPVTLLKNRPAAKESLDNYDIYARDLDANGLLGVSMGKELNNEKDSEAKKLLSEKIDRNAPKFLKFKRKKTVDNQDVVVVPQSKLGIIGGSVKKMVTDLDSMLTESYGKSDDVAKVALYKSLVDDYGKTREEAIKIVASSMQNYNTVGKAYDYASKSVNRFVKFKADSARILYNTFKERPLNLMATLGMFLAAQALASKMSGEDEEERKIREERPYTNKIKLGPVTISLTMKFGDTEVNVARYLAPYSTYDAGYDSNTFKEMSTYLPVQYDEHTFIAVNDPLIGPLVNLANDKDFRGMPISDPGMNKYISKTVTDEQAMWNRLAFAGRNYGAPYYGWVENIVAAATGDKDYYGRSRTMSDAILNTVIKVQKVDNETLQRTYEGALRKLDGDVDDAGKTISHKADMIYTAIEDKAAQENVTPEQLEKFTASQERELIKFTAEQQDLIDKKIMEMERVEGILGRLQQIKQRKQQ